VFEVSLITSSLIVGEYQGKFVLFDQSKPMREYKEAK
jgi:hypothetical protein